MTRTAVVEKRILLMRHPETVANATGILVGRGDSPYTASGRLQSARLVSVLAAWRPELIVTSPLRRTHEVASRAAGTLEMDVVLEDRFLELDFGQAEGLSYEDAIAAGVGFSFEAFGEPVADGGESRRDIWERSVAGLHTYLEECERLAIVTHGGVFRSLLPHLLGLGPEHIWTFHLYPGQIAEVSLVDGHPALEEFRVG